MTSAPAGAGGRSGRHLLVFVSAVVLVDSALYGVIAPLLPFYTAELGLSKTAAGVLVAAYPAGVFVGCFPAAWAVARFGPRPTAIMGLALFAGASLVFGLAREIELLDVARFVQGMGSAVSWTAALAWLARQTAPERRGERLGTAFSAALAGSLVGPALGAAARGVDPAIVFGITAAIGVAMIGWAFRVPAPAATEAAEGWTVALRERALLPGAAVILAVGLYFGVLEVLVPLRLDALGAGAAAIALAFALGALLEGIAGTPLGRLSDRIGALRPVQVSLVGCAVLAVLLPLPEAIGLLVFLVAISGPLEGGLFIPGMKLLADGAERARLDQGYAFGIFNLTWAITTAVGSAAGGAIADVAGDTTAYLLLAGVMAVAFAITFASSSSSSSSRRSSSSGPS